MSGKQEFTDASTHLVDTAPGDARPQVLERRRQFLTTYPARGGREKEDDGRQADIKKFVEQVGVEGRHHGDPSGVTARAQARPTSQTIGITAWTKYPEVVADFIMFTHTPERLSSWFKTTEPFRRTTGSTRA